MANVKTNDRTLEKGKGVTMCTAVKGWCVFVLGKDKTARLELLIFQSRCF